MKVIPFRTNAALAARVIGGGPLTAADYRQIMVAIERVLGPEDLGQPEPRSRYLTRVRALNGRETMPFTMSRT